MARDRLEALEHVNRETKDVMVLDVMMPNMDGIKACMRIRETEHFPIIMLSAKGQDMDKIRGLSVGADDYVTKPFSPLELVSRIKSQLRRVRRYIHTSPVLEHEMMLDELSINSATHEVALA